MQKIVLELEVDTKTGKAKVQGLEKETKKAAAATKETGKELDGVTKKLDQVSGGALSAFRAFTSGAQKGIAAMKSLRVAIALTGIGLLVTTILALQAAFTSSEEGQNRWAKIMGVVGAVTDQVVDVLATLGEVLISVFTDPVESFKKFKDALAENITNRLQGLIEFLPAVGRAISLVFQGKFSEAGEVAVNAVGKVTLGLEDTVQSTKDLIDATEEYIEKQAEIIQKAEQVADQRAEADKLERKLLVDRARLESEIAELKLKSRQEDQFSAEERKRFIQEAQQLEDSLLEKETKVLELRRDAIETENQFARSNKENLKAEAEAQAEVFRQQARRLENQRTTQRELNRLNKEAAREAKAASDERIKGIEAIDAALRSQTEEEIFNVNQKFNELRQQAIKYGRDVDEIEQRRVEALAQINDKIKAEEEKKAQAILAEEQKLSDARKAIQEQIAEVFRTDEENQIEAERRKYQTLIEEARKFGLDTEMLVQEQEQRISQIKIDSAQRAAEAERKIQVETRDANLAAVNSVLGGLQSALGEQTAAGQAAGVASAAVSTYAGAAKSLEVYGPTPLGFAGIGAALLAGFTQVKNILSVKNPFGGGGGSFGGGGGATAPPPVANQLASISPADQATLIGESAGQSLAGRPMRAYVVQKDVSSGAELADRLRLNSEFS